MLVLSRVPGESILVGDDVQITVLSVHGDRVRLGIKAPREVPIHRMEVVESIKREGRRNEDQP